MKTIWKWPLAVTDLQSINMPAEAQILCVQMQGDVPQIWALVDPEMPKDPRQIVIFGTGHQTPNYPGRYISTFQMHGGALVFHAFEAR